MTPSTTSIFLEAASTCAVKFANFSDSLLQEASLKACKAGPCIFSRRSLAFFWAGVSFSVDPGSSSAFLFFGVVNSPSTLSI